MGRTPMYLFNCSQCAIRVYSSRAQRERGCPRCHGDMTRVDPMDELLLRSKPLASASRLRDANAARAMPVSAGYSASSNLARETRAGKRT
jgi:hypothetical protein